MPELTGSAAVDVLIGLSFVYLLFSLLLSAVQEAIAGVFDLRATNLEKAIRGLLENPSAGAGGSKRPQGVETDTQLAGLADQFYGHALIQGLYKDSKLRLKGRTGPSYIPARTFATAVMDVLAPAGSGDDLVVEAKRRIEKLPAGGTQQALLALVTQFGDDRDKLRKELEGWFDGSMARASGWYKRKAQLILCGLAAACTLGLNVDTITIADRLVRDDTLRTELAAQGRAAARQPAQQPPVQSRKDQLEGAAKDVNDLKALGVPIGRSNDPESPVYYTFGNAREAVRKLGGWLLTFIALSLGAPFWFDTLSKLARLRNTGAPEKPQDTAPTGTREPQELNVTVHVPPSGSPPAT